MSMTSIESSILNEIQRLREEREKHLQQAKVCTSCIYELQLLAQGNTNGNQINH